MECDEYPFASTQEGSTKGDNRFSVRLIDVRTTARAGSASTRCTPSTAS
ncbi:NucA/NucB deoxyribonuclease domain-containing protein [Streptomyces massasporeus]